MFSDVTPECHPTPVLLPGKSHGWRSLVGYSPRGSQRVGHDWATSLSFFPFMHWRRKRQPTPVFLPGESQGWWSLVGCRLWGRASRTRLTWLSSSSSRNVCSYYVCMCVCVWEGEREKEREMGWEFERCGIVGIVSSTEPEFSGGDNHWTADRRMKGKPGGREGDLGSDGSCMSSHMKEIFLEWRMCFLGSLYIYISFQETDISIHLSMYNTYI